MNNVTTFPLDLIDEKILDMLKVNSRIAFTDIAKELSLSGSAVHYRINRMESDGILAFYTIYISPQSLGYSLTAFVWISLSMVSKYRETVALLSKIPEIVESHYITGKHSILCKIFCRDNNHLMNVLADKVQTIEYVTATHTQISLDTSINRSVTFKEV